MSNPLSQVKKQSRRILVVDDEPHVAGTIRMVLTHAGHSVDIVPSAQNALAAFAVGKYDLIMSDLSLGKMNGLQLADAIKAQAPGQAVILVTAHAESIQRDKARLDKVDGLLGKPFTLNQLQVLLDKIFPPTTEVLVTV